MSKYICGLKKERILRQMNIFVDKYSNILKYPNNLLHTGLHLQDSLGDQE